MAKTLYLMRHGQTVLNERHRIQGWFDSPLTELGRAQARAAGHALVKRGVRIDRALCSTSERCSDTLELVLEALGCAGMSYERVRAIKEMDFGNLDGEPDYLACDDPEGCRTYYLPFQGESSDVVRDRMVRALARAMDDLPGDASLLVVSHGGSCYNFARALHVDIRLSNADVAVLSYEASGFSPSEALAGEGVNDAGDVGEAPLRREDILGAVMPEDVARHAAAFAFRGVIEAADV